MVAQSPKYSKRLKHLSKRTGKQVTNQDKAGIKNDIKGKS